jgi:ABC-type Mn2+/Zn2+ transport system ATPase subunit
MSESTLIRLSDVLIQRGRHRLLQIDHWSLEFPQCVGVIGPNGAGKTTLLKVCCGQIKPGRGSVWFEQQCISPRRCLTPARYRRQLCYIPQQTEYNAHLPFTVREVVAMGRSAIKPLFHPLNRGDREAVDQWLHRLGLYERKDQTFRSLSGGQQQKVLIARAMVAQPRLILMDEPGANLDVYWKRKLTDTIDDLYAEHPMALLWVSHELDILPAACKRLILLDRGKLVRDDTREKVLQAECTRRAFHGG